MKTTTRHESRQNDKRVTRLPQPGRKKKNPRELDKLLDKGIEDSMIASDVPAVTQPEVHTEPDRDAESVETGNKKSDKDKM
jgi:hypothetical protein